MSLGLRDREGLPDALRVLLANYPRDAWEAHPNFTALTRFWLERHLMFRRLQGILVTETEAFLDRGRDPRAYAGGLARLASAFLDGLHGHHMIEDEHYFPLLQGLEPRLESGFALLDADHHALDGAMHDLALAANAVLRAVKDAAADLPSEQFRAELLGFGRLLDRHLTDEEEVVVPVILAHPGAGLG